MKAKLSIKKLKKKEENRNAQLLIKQSDIKASNPVKIDDIKKVTTQSLIELLITVQTEEFKQMQKAVPTEGTFNEKMRISSEIFNAHKVNEEQQNTSATQQNLIMEVEEAEIK